MKIREVEVDDAEQLLSLHKQLDYETEFMLYEADERLTTLEEQKSVMANFCASDSKVILVAVDKCTDKIMAYTAGVGSDLKRNGHQLYCIIGVLQEYSGKGVGRKLLTELETWARCQKLHRLELTVMEHNTRAVSLYKSFGFETEGVKRHSLKISGKYINELLMSKLLSN